MDSQQLAAIDANQSVTLSNADEHKKRLAIALAKLDQ